MSDSGPRPPVRFAPASVSLEERPDGSRILRCNHPLPEAVRQSGVWLRHWAEVAPERTFLAERRDGEWHRVSYADARRAVDALSDRLLGLKLSAERPLATLSDNSIDSGLLQLASAQVGIPSAPISPAYSLLTHDFTRLRGYLARITPGAIYADDSAVFGPALGQVSGTLPRLYSTRAPRAGVAQHAFDVREWIATAADTPTDRVERAFAAVDHDSIAKFLFTSGSTGEPKAVINTQRMICTNQAMGATLWPFVKDRPPVVLDWLPWSHTFGGNHNFNMVLANGGTLYIDDGKPAPGRLQPTLDNLRDVSPTIYFNVPRGFAMLLPHLERDEELARGLFGNLDVLFYAAAALPQELWERLVAVAARVRDEPVVFASGWGATETAPLATLVHFPIERSDLIGGPAPGVELKFVPSGSKQEIRLRGPNITPGYWRQPELTAEMFDEEGFYKIGDAARLVDDDKPELGILFDGRVAEDFKLLTGSWVNVGRLRSAIVGASNGVLLDAVLCGHDRDFVAILGVPNLEVVDELSANLGPNVSLAAKLAHPKVVEALQSGLAPHARSAGGSSECVRRALLLSEPLSIDAGELTDKGYVNQRAVREHRPHLVEALYADPASGVGEHVIEIL